MARKPEVFVRALSMEEGRKLQRITRSAKDPVKLRRAIVVLMSAQGQSASAIRSLMQVSDDYVRSVVHAFNERGFDALDPKWSGGRPRRIGEWVRERICLIARTTPAEWGITAFSTWSLAKLAAHLENIGLVTSLSVEHLRRILKTGGVSWQTTTTWKSSNDPDFITKMHAVLTLYDTPPEGGRVICVDEFGPLNLMPRKGKTWRPAGHPARLRATFNRNDGVRHMLGALDLATGRIYYRIRNRKRWREFLSFLKSLRARWPGERLHVICDNYSPHKHPEVRAWATANDVDLVFLPTYGSWLNWIESEFAALRYFALNGTDHRSHREQNTAIGAYIRWHNQHARPKTSFAASSPIRSWTSYPSKVA
ncbi:transposase [Actinocorallia herbida]|uniref:Transposase n=1 Tax=Actinocorallia herbida TaxID=58109 RepID=A0A3N1CQP0_9ACTN|nr:IS630 family transposase [Actinocorallia herbida]ROO83048.1 transposase [Actinocorallia herbida]